MNPDEAPTVPPARPANPKEPSEPHDERYVLGDKLGEGAMGAVWVARDVALDRDVAFKVLHDALLGADNQERLAAEARAMARLSHPNVVAVYDVGVRAGRTYLTMELVRGSSLSTWLDTPRTHEQIVDVFRGAAAGLAAAHAAGIVHRDVKPTNILVGDDGRARVADFGVAHAATVQPGVGERVTAETAGMIGSPAYMAPEQLAGEPSDGRADQFGLCVSLYEALHGVRPFSAATIGGLIMAITRGAPAPVRDVPPWLHAVVARGLAASPEARFPSMTALGAALSGARPRRRWIAVLGVGAIAAVGIAFVATREHSDEQPPVAPLATVPVDAAPAAIDGRASALRTLGDGIHAFENKDYVTALELFDRAIPHAEDPLVPVMWAARTSCDLVDEKRARAYLAKLPKDTSEGRKARSWVVAHCANIDLRDTVVDESPPTGSATGSAKPIAKVAKPPPVVPDPVPVLDPKQRLERYLELRKQWQASAKAGDYAGTRTHALEAIKYQAPGQLDAYTVVINASCRLGDKTTARAMFGKLPATTNFGKNTRVVAVGFCEKLGIQMADLLYPEERKHVAP